MGNHIDKPSKPPFEKGGFVVERSMYNAKKQADMTCFFYALWTPT